MGSVMKKLLSIALMLVVVFSGFKLYVHHQISTDIDQFVQAASPFAHVQYKNLSTSFLDKSLTLHDVEVIPTGTSAPITVDELSFYDVNLVQRKRSWFTKMDWSQPSEQGFSVRGLALNVNEHLTQGPLRQLSKLKGADPEWLTKLGYSKLVVDLDMSMINQPKEGKVTLLYQQAQEDMFNVGMVATLQPKNQTQASSVTSLELVSAHLEYNDHSFLNRFFNYQAKTEDKSIETVKNEWFDKFNSNLRQKELKLEEAQLSAIKNLIYREFPIFIDIRPTRPMDQKTLGSLHLYDPQEVLRMLQLSISNQEKTEEV